MPSQLVDVRNAEALQPPYRDSRTVRSGLSSLSGRKLVLERGRTFYRVNVGDRVAGKLRGSVQLASCRFAMLDDGPGFSLVPCPHGLSHEGLGTRADSPPSRVRPGFGRKSMSTTLSFAGFGMMESYVEGCL
jgi:Protein of unknown function (DUF3363)